MLQLIFALCFQTMYTSGTGVDVSPLAFCIFEEKNGRILFLIMFFPNLCVGDLDGDDNCPLTSNPNQDNNDQDEYGDVCDIDIDGDGKTRLIHISILYCPHQGL